MHVVRPHLFENLLMSQVQLVLFLSQVLDDLTELATLLKHYSLSRLQEK